MKLELGPVFASDVRAWTKFARRLICEMRLDQAEFSGVASPDLMSAWSDMIDTLDHHPATADKMFRWSGEVDVEVGEYLLHGLLRCLDSKRLRTRMTSHEQTTHLPVTKHIVQSFVDGLTAEGSCHLELVDQVRAAFGGLLDH